jgi:hypothetical protein
VTALNEAGLSESFTIDGEDVRLPNALDGNVRLRQAVEECFNGRMRVTGAWDGEYLPDVADVWEFLISYHLDDQESSTISFLEELRTAGGVHTLAFWKKRSYLYTVPAGQVYFYLPRPDAYNHAGRSAAGYKAEVKINGTPMAAGDITYPGTVTSGTSVAAGDVAISTTTTTHPDSGAEVTLFKFGSGVITTGDLVRVSYHPLFNVAVGDVSTRFELVGREDKQVFLVEVS